MLVYFDPWMAGVVYPGLIIFGLAAMPYIAMSLVILVAIFFFPAIATWLPAVLGGR